MLIVDRRVCVVAPLTVAPAAAAMALVRNAGQTDATPHRDFMIRPCERYARAGTTTASGSQTQLETSTLGRCVATDR